MRFELCAIACAFAVVVGDSSSSSSECDDRPTLVVDTPAGAIRGRWDTSLRGAPFRSFQGIRYAEPPVGKLRFQPPRPIRHYSEEVNATQDGPACPQPTFSPDYPVDEDCLRLNVYTTHPDNGSAPLPVLVYFHPGGFYSISGRSDVAGPHYLMDKHVVLVTVNYRLASLGFLSTGDKYAPGNNGFKDQVIALRWIRRNIAAFGGNPNLVTLMGYSAGSLSIGLHMVSPMTRGLFHRAIMMSATPISQVVIGSDQRYLAERQARLFNCSTATTREIVDCLKRIPWRDMGNSLDSMFEFGYDPVLLWNVVIEPDFGQERFLTEQPLDLIRRGDFYQVPLIISQTRDEFFWKAFNVLNNETLLTTMNEEWDRVAPIAFMLPPEGAAEATERLRAAYLGDRNGDIVVRNDSATADGLGKLYSDAVIGFGVHRFANLMARYSSQPTWFYEFAYVGNSSYYVDPVTGRPVGTAHHDDLIYLFTIPAAFPVIPLTSPDRIIVDRMLSLVYNLAKNGNPNPLVGSDVSWPHMTTQDQEYLRIDDGFSVHSRLFEERYSIWDQLYPLPNDEQASKQ